MQQVKCPCYTWVRILTTDCDIIGGMHFSIPYFVNMLHYHVTSIDDEIWAICVPLTEKTNLINARSFELYISYATKALSDVSFRRAR